MKEKKKNHPVAPSKRKGKRFMKWLDISTDDLKCHTDDEKDSGEVFFFLKWHTVNHILELKTWGKTRRLYPYKNKQWAGAWSRK